MVVMCGHRLVVSFADLTPLSVCVGGVARSTLVQSNHCTWPEQLLPLHRPPQSGGTPLVLVGCVLSAAQWHVSVTC